MSRLHIQLLGTFQVLQNGRSLTGFRTDKIRALLAYLAVESGRPQRRDSLASLLWPEMDDQKARYNLRLSLHRLRRTLGDEALVLQVDRHSVQFEAAQAWVDVLVFRQAMTAVATHDHPQPETCSTCMAHLETAVSHYHGDFLPGFFLADDLTFAEWLTTWRERLHQEALQALAWLADYHQVNGRLTQAIPIVRRQLELEPWRESAQRQLMQLLAQTGQYAAALHQYDICYRLLRDELEVEPDAETVYLYEKIRDEKSAQERSLTKGNFFPSILSSTQQITAHLPTTAVPFVGRQAELQGLTQLLAEPEVRLLTIVGAGGMGKTRLALAFAAAQVAYHAEQFPHGVYFVSLTAVTSAERLLPAIAQALPFTPELDDSSRLDNQQLFDYLQTRQILCVLDNFEQLLDKSEAQAATAVLGNLLQQAPLLKLLVTSRERLQLQMEQIFQLGGLQYPTTADLKLVDFSVNNFSALQLFQQSARRTQPTFNLRTTELPDLLAICRLLDGLPLGLELAAAWGEWLPLAEIASEMQNNLDFLAADMRDWPDRHRSLRLVFDDSWARLSQPEQTLFAQLSLFRGSFTRAALQAVAGKPQDQLFVLQLLRSLVRKSLLRYDRLHDRYALHELLRQYGAEKLAQRPDESNVQEQFAAYYCHWLQQQEKSLQGERQKEMLIRIEADWENIRVAWDRAVQNGLDTLLAGAAFCLGVFLLRHGRYAEGLVLFRTTSSRLQANNETGEGRLLALARIYYWQAVFEPATAVRQQYLEHSLALLEEATASENTIWADKAAVLLELGIVAHGQGRFEKTDQYFKQSLTFYRVTGNQWGEANVLFELGVRAWRKGDFDLAEDWFNHCLNLRCRLGDLLGTAVAWEGLSGTAMFSGYTTNALEYIRKSYAVYEQLADQAGMARMKIKQAQMTWYQNLEGLDLFEEGLANLAELGARRNVALYTVLLAMHQADEDIDRAAKGAELGRSLCHELGYQRGAAIAQGVMSRVALVRGHYAEAFALAEAYLHDIRALTHSVEYSDALIWLGWASVALHDWQRAEQCVREVLQLPNYWRVACLHLTAVLLTHRSAENVEWSWRLLGYGECHYARHRGAVSQQILSRFLPAAMKRISTEQVARLKEQGQQLDEKTIFSDLQSRFC